ncbi:MAG TPA: inositol monophosphatase family protein [Chloroflexota bacterium]|nr:inositol monophosphatase family protein [Chloroflexota bacterium]
MTNVPSEIVELAVSVTRAGGAILREKFGTVLEVRYKGEIDVVTEVDVLAEAAIVAPIRSVFPDHQVLAEEGTTGGRDPNHRWIIDPLDGTTNYSHGQPPFAVSVAYEHEGRVQVGVIYDPTQDELFVAERGGGATLNGRPLHVSNVSVLRRALLATGFPYERERLPLALGQFGAFAHRSQAIRRIGSAALDLAYVAAGRFDAYWESSIRAWDIAAGILLVEEAGGTISDIYGAPLDLNSEALTVLASNSVLHPAMLETLGRARPIQVD